MLLTVLKNFKDNYHGDFIIKVIEGLLHDINFINIIINYHY